MKILCTLNTAKKYICFPNKKCQSVRTMPYQSSVIECGHSVSYPKQRTLKAIDNIANSNSIGNRFNTTDALDTQFSTKRKDQQL